MKAKFNEKKNTLKVNGEKFNVLSVKTELKGGDLKDGEWVNNKGYITFEIEEMEEQPEAPEAPEQPQRKFKVGDKVRIKEGISSRTHEGIGPSFEPEMDKLIGKTMKVKRYVCGEVECVGLPYSFTEDWLEPWSYEKEELKEGDLAMFWDVYPDFALITAFSKKEGGLYLDSALTPWMNAVKFECTKEQKEFFNKVRKGEITL